MFVGCVGDALKEFATHPWSRCVMDEHCGGRDSWGTLQRLKSRVNRGGTGSPTSHNGGDSVGKPREGRIGRDARLSSDHDNPLDARRCGRRNKNVVERRCARNVQERLVGAAYAFATPRRNDEQVN
jgi:hypothetical protein